MIEYKFKTYGELVDFLNKRKDDKRACYYFGDIDCMNGELYSIEDIRHEARPDWFYDNSDSEYSDEEPVVCNVYEFEIDPIYAVIIKREADYEVIICKDKESTSQTAENEWNRLTHSEKDKYVVRGVMCYVDYERDRKFLEDEYGFDSSDVDMENLTDRQKEILIVSGYDVEFWNSYEWEERDVWFKTAWGNWKKAFLDVEDALCEFESDWDEEEYGEFSDDTEVSLEVGKDKYGRYWFSVAKPNEFANTDVDGVKTWWKWYDDEWIEEVKLS